MSIHSMRKGQYQQRGKNQYTKTVKMLACLGPDASDAVADIVDLGGRPETVAPQQWVQMAVAIGARDGARGDNRRVE